MAVFELCGSAETAKIEVFSAVFAAEKAKNQ